MHLSCNDTSSYRFSRRIFGLLYQLCAAAFRKVAEGAARQALIEAMEPELAVVSQAG